MSNQSDRSPKPKAPRGALGDSGLRPSPGVDGTGEVAAGGSGALSEIPTDDALPEMRLEEPSQLIAFQEPSPDMVERVIDDRYRIIGLLGEGGMGEVYVAEHLKLHKKVALKVVRAEFSSDEDVAARLAREAMATAQIDHPHVCNAIDYGTVPEGGAYLVTALVNGNNLEDELSAVGRMHWARAARIASQVADALAVAKEAGIVHRDLKPENIVIQRRDGSEDLVKVLDFGIARLKRTSMPAPAGAQPRRKLTHTGSIIGTPGYMAPEQFVGEPADHAADLYALGVVLWECITGLNLWDAEDLQALFTKQLSEKPARLSEVVQDPTLPQELDDLVDTLLARDPKARPSEPAVVRDVLRRIAYTHSSDVEAPRDISAASMEALEEGQEEDSGELNAGEVKPRRSRAPFMFFVLTLVVAAGGFWVVLDPAQMYGGAPRADITEEPTVTNTSPPPLARPSIGDVLRDTAQQVGSTVETVTGKLKKGSQSDARLPIPPELVTVVRDLMEGETRTVRVRAARSVLDHANPDEVPEFLTKVAVFQQARRCQGKKAALSGVLEAGDPRALPALQRLADRPKRGCGPRNRRDCLACMRAELDGAIAELAEKRAQGQR